MRTGHRHPVRSAAGCWTSCRAIAAAGLRRHRDLRQRPGRLPGAAARGRRRAAPTSVSTDRPVPAGPRRRRACRRTGSPHTLRRVRAKLDGRRRARRHRCCWPARTSARRLGRRPRPARRAAARRSATRPPSTGVHRRLRGAGLGPARQPGRPGLGGRAARRPPRRDARRRHLPHARPRRRRHRARRHPRVTGSASCRSRTARCCGWTCSSGAGTSAASPARASSTSPGWSPPLSRPATAARSRSRSSATWSARPTRS